MIHAKPLQTKGLRSPAPVRPSTVNIPSTYQHNTNKIPVKYQVSESPKISDKELVLKIVEHFAPIKVSEVEYIASKVKRLDRGKAEGIMKAYILKRIMVRLKINNVYHYMVTNDGKDVQGLSL